jgi:trk system potassium uptake protein TrkA
MRAVFIGTNALSLATGQLLLAGDHEVVYIERDRERIATLAEELDCGFLHGDGTEPAVLRDAQPEHTDVLFCLLGSDQTNIIASLVGRSLGFPRVFTRIDKGEFQEICNELGLEDTVLTNRAVALHLLDALRGERSLEMSALIREDAAVFRFVASEADAVPVAELGLPRDTRIVCLYRDDRFTLPEQVHRLQAGDEVILIAGSDRLEELRERWAPPEHRD